MASPIPFGQVPIEAVQNSALLGAYDFLVKPNVNPALIAGKYPAETRDLVSAFKAGQFISTMNQTVNWAEKNQTFGSARTATGTATAIRGIASGLTPAQVNGVSVPLNGLFYFKLDAASCSPATTQGGIAAGTRCNIRVNNIIWFPTFSQNAQYIVQYVDNSTPFEIILYCKPVNANTSITPAPATLIPAVSGNVNGVEFSYVQNIDSEAGKGMFKGLIPTYVNKSATLSAMTEYAEITDFAQNTKAWYEEYQNLDGTPGKIYTFQNDQFDDAMNTYLKAVATKLAFGANITSNIYDGAAVSGSAGYINQIVSESTALTYGTAPTLSILRQLVRLLNKKKMTSEIDLSVGMELDMLLDDLFRDTLVDGAVVYEKDNLDFQYAKVSYGGMTIHKKQLAVLNDPNNAAIDGSPYPYYGIVMPRNEISVMEGPEGFRKPVSIKNLTFRYNPVAPVQGFDVGTEVSGGVSRFFKAYTTGGLSRIPTDSHQVLKLHFHGVVASVIAAADQTILLAQS
jgi:hypothetical protein